MAVARPSLPTVRIPDWTLARRSRYRWAMFADVDPTPTQGPQDDGGLTVAQAAGQLGVSPDSVRRRLKVGELVGHRRQTKHGPAWCIHPDELPGSREGWQDGPATLMQGSAEGSATVAQGSADDVGDARPSEDATGTSLMQAEAMAAYTRSVLEPMVAAMERAQGRIGELENANGRLTLALEHAQEQISSLEAHAADARAEPPLGLLVRWRWLLATLALAIVLAGVLLIWPR